MLLIRDGIGVTWFADRHWEQIRITVTGVELKEGVGYPL